MCISFRCERLFDCEAGADVVFLVGPEGWRFPAHTAVLSGNSPYFRTLFTYPVSGPIAVPDVDGRAFDLLLRYIYNKCVEIRSTDTALCTLYVAHKYLCSGLMAECVNYLDKNMNGSNCLEIYQHVRLHCGPHQPPSAPREGENVPDMDELFSHSINMCAELMWNCSRFIDSNADSVLGEEGIEDLPGDCLREILERDTLQVSSESVTYSAVERWANSQCKRHRLELCHKSRRAVVSDRLLFSVRFLLMDEKTFYSGPMGGQLLTQQESQTLLGLILEIPDTPSVPTLTEDVLYKISMQRISLRSKPNTSQNKCKKKDKKAKKDGSETQKDKCSSSCALDYMVRGLACLFD